MKTVIKRELGKINETTFRFLSGVGTSVKKPQRNQESFVSLTGGARTTAMFTYCEEQEDTEAQNVPRSRDAVKALGLLCFSPQSCHNSISTPHGFPEEREATLGCILHQKKETTPLMKADESNRVPSVRSAKSCSSHGAGPGAALPEGGGGHGKPSPQPLHVQGPRMPQGTARSMPACSKGKGCPAPRPRL